MGDGEGPVCVDGAPEKKVFQIFQSLVVKLVKSSALEVKGTRQADKMEGQSKGCLFLRRTKSFSFLHM